jgi:hypothetical protein
MHVSSARAAAQGFTVTEPRASAVDVRAWLAEHPVTPALSPERERSLIATARAAQT